MIESIFLFCYYKIKLYLCSVIKDPLCPYGHLTSIAQRTAPPSLRHRLTFSQSSKGLVHPLWGEFAIGFDIKGTDTKCNDSMAFPIVILNSFQDL